MKEIIIQILITAGVVAPTALGMMKLFSNKQDKSEGKIKNHIEETANKASVGLNILAMKKKLDNVLENLGALKDYLNADHAWIGLFHNGEYIVGGEHFIKLTSTYELPAGGFTTSKGNRVSTNELLRSVPLLHMGEWIEENLKDNWYIKDVNDIRSPLLRDSYLDWELKEGVNIMIYLDEEQTLPMGVIGLNWVKKEVNLLDFFNVKTNKQVVENIRELSKGLIYTLKA